METQELQSGMIVRGPLFPEPVELIDVAPFGDQIRMTGRGIESNQVYDPILDRLQVAQLEVTSGDQSFDGNAVNLRLAVEAVRLSLAYEFDPYFALSVARVDPLPHQLEAVYDAFLEAPRLRFLLADDPGAGKTIMAGLTIKELKARGLIDRILIITPAKLCFQWQREMHDKFRESFEIVKGSILRANYGQNPWRDKDQVITSIDWASRIEDAKDSLLQTTWDLIVVDEAHKMSAYSRDRKTLAYQLGEQLSDRTDHLLLMTATPHKGDPDNFCLFLELLDRDVYADVASLQEAMRRREAPFYLRRVKEALVTFPDPETGQVKTLFTKRNVQTCEFDLNRDEAEFYRQLTHYVDDQSVRASRDDSARGRALGFTMAMLQRRFASSIYAVRRSLERMKEKREHILEDPEAYKQEQIAKRLPEDFEDLEEDEKDALLQDLESIVTTVDPAELRHEIAQLERLVDHASELESREVETKLTRLKEVITEQGLFDDPKMKLLVFTEHRETCQYLVEKLCEWDLSVTQIHGGMKIGDRDTPGTRLCAEREFREDCQVMVATEAAGEGINLQFCWFMINYDLPWNPVRLEQRMGRIHRYGQERDCLIINFVAGNTREGRVLGRLLERIRAIEDDLDPDRTGKVFNVLGDVLPANQLEGMLREMYAHNLTEDVITDRIVERVDTSRFREITESALEGLAKRELNLSAIVGKSAEARERRLVPEVVQDFFLTAGPLVGASITRTRRNAEVYRVDRLPQSLQAIGEQLEGKYGRLGREYKSIVFDKEFLEDDPTVEWVTPGHPLFECVREALCQFTQDDLDRGAVFWDIHRESPARLDVFTAAINDGSGKVLHRRLFVIESSDGEMWLREPTVFLDIVPADDDARPPLTASPDRSELEVFLFGNALVPMRETVKKERQREIQTILRHLHISLNELIHRQNLMLASFVSGQEAGDDGPTTSANIKRTQDRIDDLNLRLERRERELQREANRLIADIRHLCAAWVLPHPERTSEDMRIMVRDDEVERIAIENAIAHEVSRGWEVESVEDQNRGFDLISRKPHPEQPDTAVGVRFIEVKGRAEIGNVALSSNEYRTADRIGEDYWLYVVFNCSSVPQLQTIQDPARLGWEPITTIEHYQLPSRNIMDAHEG